MDDQMTVSTIMTTNVVTVSSETSIPDVARVMVEHGISGVPVIDAGRLVGIVTDSDVVSREIDVDAPAYATFLDAIFVLPWDRSDDELKRVMATTAAGIMSSPVRTIEASASISALADLMFKQHVNPVPVVDATGAVVGIVSRTDVIRLIADAG
jgi:CBS domain-containing protein